MKKELSIQVYTVRDAMQTAEQTADTFQKLAAYGYTGIQTAGAFSFGVEAYAKAAQDAGLRVVGTHLGLDLLEDTQETVRIHKLLGTTKAGTGGMPGMGDESFDYATLEHLIERMNRIAENLGHYGMKFTYHNHSREFARIHGRETIMDILVKELDPKNASFVLDTYWVQHAGGNVLEWIEKLAGRIDILHLKDKAVPLHSNDGQITELGAGNLNFKEILRVADASGVKDYCYEQDYNFRVDPLESAKESAAYFYSLFD